MVSLKHSKSPANKRTLNTRLMINKSFSKFVIKLYEKRERDKEDQEERKEIKNSSGEPRLE